MTQIDDLATMLKGLTAKQLQLITMATPNRDGSKIRAKRIAHTEAYFARVKDEGLYPHNYPTFPQFREVLQ